MSEESAPLQKTMRWWDGFVIGLANPGFLLVGLGPSVAALGTKVAAVVWPISALIGMLQAMVYAETAAMFPDKPGGIAVYANEGWRQYSTLVGPVALFGYWFAWSGVLAIYGGLIGHLVVDEFLFVASPANPLLNIHPIGSFRVDVLGVPVTTVRLVGAVSILLCWVFNVRGMKTAVGLTYVTGAMMLVPILLLAIGPFVTGAWTGHPVSLVAIGTTLTDVYKEPATWGNQAAFLMVWLYVIGWSTYGPEAPATFAPEFKDSTADTRKAIQATGLFNLVLTALMPIAVVGTLGYGVISGDKTGVLYLTLALNALAGPTLGALCVVFLIAGLLLTMNTATMDGSRALYAMAKEGLTIRQLAVLNRHGVPGRAMTFDLLLNVFLLFAFPSIFFILAAGNLGYMLTHVAALTGFLLLRRDRPDWPRPIRLGRAWPWLAAAFAVFNVVLTVVGVWGLSFTGYAWDDDFTDPSAYVGRCIGVSLLALVTGAVGFWVAERQNGRPFRWRNPSTESPAPELLAPATERV